jgi:hypothetical protein
MTQVRHSTTLPSPGDSFNVLLQKFSQIIEDIVPGSLAHLGDGDYLVLWRVMRTSVLPPTSYDAFRTMLDNLHRAVVLPAKLPSDSEYRWLWKTLVAWS